MEHLCRVVAPCGPGIAKHVESDSVADVFPGAHAVDRFLHLAVPAVAAFHGVGGRRPQLLVEEREGLFQIGAEAFLERFADLLEAAHPSAELGQFLKGRLAPAAAVKEVVDFVHDRPQRPQRLVPAPDLRQRLPFGRSQVVLDEEVAVVKHVGHPLLQRVLGPGLVLRFLRCGTTAGELGDLSSEGFAYPGDGLEHRLRDLCDSVEFADLVWHVAEDLRDRAGGERRGVGRDTQYSQAAGVEGRLKGPEEAPDVRVGGVVVQHVIDEPLEPAVIHNGQHTEGPVVELVGGDVAREVNQGPSEVVRGHRPCRFFSHWPPPSSGWW
jgi:hypothetical protein